MILYDVYCLQAIFTVTVLARDLNSRYTCFRPFYTLLEGNGHTAVRTMTASKGDNFVRRFFFCFSTQSEGWIFGAEDINMYGTFRFVNHTQLYWTNTVTHSAFHHLKHD